MFLNLRNMEGAAIMAARTGTLTRHTVHRLGHVVGSLAASDIDSKIVSRGTMARSTLAELELALVDTQTAAEFANAVASASAYVISPNLNLRLAEALGSTAAGAEIASLLNT